MSDQEGDSSTDAGIDMANAETPINCTTCVSLDDSCDHLSCRVSCAWSRIGKQCRNKDALKEPKSALLHVHASLRDPETSVNCPHWQGSS